MFDRYVQGTKPSWKRRAVLTVSLALHAIAVVVLVVYSFIHVEEITPPALSLTFFSAPPPPPPPPPPAAHHKEVKPHPKVVPTQPTVIPQLVQPKEEPEDDSSDDGEEGGVEGGVAGGVAGGVVGGVVGGVGAGTGPVKPKNVPPYMLDQQKISGDAPHLPDIVKIQRKGTGDAIFMAKICIDQSGRVSQISVIQGIPGADQSILATLRTWKYKPQPLPICSMSRFVFSIN